MQLAKNNNAMWRAISDGDQPLPPDSLPAYYSTLTTPPDPQYVRRKSSQGQQNVAESTEKVI